MKRERQVGRGLALGLDVDRPSMVGPRQYDVISRFKVQVQLESLILAQSERWRQA